MVSDDSFQVIKKFILQCISLIGFDEIHATLIFTTYFRSIFFIIFLVIERNIFCSLYIAVLLFCVSVNFLRSYQRYTQDAAL